MHEMSARLPTRILYEEGSWLFPSLCLQHLAQNEEEKRQSPLKTANLLRVDPGLFFIIIFKFSKHQNDSYNLQIRVQALASCISLLGLP